MTNKKGNGLVSVQITLTSLKDYDLCHVYNQPYNIIFSLNNSKSILTKEDPIWLKPNPNNNNEPI